MGKVAHFIDRLSNVMSGMGTSIDRRSGRRYKFLPLDHAEAEAGYRTSWLIRKIVDVPAKDMTRAWRNWQASKEQISAIEKEEKRLQLRDKVKRALILSRLFGGGALILGTKDSNPSLPLDVEQIGKDGLTYVHAMGPKQLSLGPNIEDLKSEWYGKPSYFEIHSKTGSSVKLHPSRVVAFVGQRAPEGSAYSTVSGFWGDPIMQSIGEAVGNADTAQAGFAALIDEAKLDIIKIPDMMEMAQTEEGDARLMKRLQVSAMGKSTWRALLLDEKEEWEQRQINWAGIPQVLTTFLEICSGAADIPVTRLLGQSPKGLQSTGKGEADDYDDKVKADQDEILAPALDQVDELLIRSALGSRPEEIYYEFADLVEPDEKAEAEIEKLIADTLKIYADTGILHEEALTDIAKNRMIESGRWPGSEEAFEAAGDIDRDEDSDADDPAALAAVQTRGENVLQFKKRGAVTADQATLLMADASPRSLYVRRDVVNKAEIAAWAKSQGIDDLNDDLHVTIAYSRQPLDWMKAGNANDWGDDKAGQITITAGGPRVIEPLGDQSAVLMFASTTLQYRHQSIIEAGASHDYGNYIPHVSLTKSSVDLESIKPYRGPIVLGPEIFEEVKDAG